MVATDESEKDDEHEHDAGPNETRHDAEGTSELLDGETGGVEGDGIHSNAREGENNEEELGKADWVHHHLNEPADALVPRIEPVRLEVQGRAAESTENEAETSRNRLK